MISEAVRLGFKKVHPDAKMPEYAHKGDAGMDVCTVEDYCLGPGERHLFSTGICANIPTGFEIQVRSRSGLALKRGVCVLNSPGTIDESYSGVIGVILVNLGEECVYVSKGDRIAQLVVSPVTNVEPYETEDVKHSERGSSGFGSSGGFSR